MQSKVRLLLVAALCAASMFAQEFRATITGRVIDSSGAVVPNVTVRAINIASNETSTAVTDSNGVYTIPFLRPGQ